jgi:cation transport ATPase
MVTLSKALPLILDHTYFEKIYSIKSSFIRLFSHLGNRLSSLDLERVHRVYKGIKITKGNELRHCPYQVLDLVRDFDKNNGFNIRVLHWWGRGMFVNILLGQEKTCLVNYHILPGYLKEKNVAYPENAKSDEAETIVFVFREDELAGFIALSDKIREESPKAVQILKENGIKLYMATGDNEKTAKAVSENLGLDGYYSEVLPHQKVEIIEQLQGEGHFVAMTGDGVNDAPALAKADVGIAVGSGTDVAAETADIILVNSNPSDIVSLLLFGRATYKKMIQNLAWATGYNAVALPLATGFIPGLIISPAVGAIFMSLSTVIVAINAQLLRYKINK